MEKSRPAYDARNAVFIPVSKPFRASQVVHDFFSINGTTAPPPSTILSPLSEEERQRIGLEISDLAYGEKRMGKNGTENGYLHLKGDQDAKGKEDRLPGSYQFSRDIHVFSEG